MDYIALAVAPGLAICIFIFSRDIYNREPSLNLIMSFIFGVVSIVPAFFIENSLYGNIEDSIPGIAIKSFFLIALTEEACKFAALRLYSYRQRSFDEPFDGIVYSVMVSMGFATLENIFYVLKAAQEGHVYQVALVRMFLSVPAHATFGVLMGYHVGRAKFELGKEKRLMMLGLFWAVLFHGLFDTLLFWQQSADIRKYTPGIALFGGAVVSFIVALRLSLRLIYKHRLLSQRTFRPTAALNLRKAYPADVPLIRDLSLKIWPHTYADILPADQVSYMMDLMYSEQALKDQMKQKIEFVIINDGSEPVGFASFSYVEQGKYKLHKIYLLPTMQGKGAGRFVIDQLILAMRNHGGKVLELNVNRNNRARHFYEKLGFAVVREEDIDIGKGYFMNDYIMQKELDAPASKAS
jgi:RsiW-degrading membrane proteinase PrsW (M82 family)/ribosomal protein S18 acetylase RimI-like enzyme